MIFEKIITPELSQYSYFLADSSEAVVIDPITDCDIYVNLAIKYNLRIIYILETHCHEDFLSGSKLLSNKTGAEIWHADSDSDYSYGFPVYENQTWEIGKLKLEAVFTPGHTSGSMSYLLYDHHGSPWVIFTGDTLFSGDVGRVDLMGIDKTEEMASFLYNSIFSKILLLGDQLIVCPSHGAGSVCGKSISNRIWTTIGLERLHNPKLQFVNELSFIKAVAEELDKPPYFSKMKSQNTNGQIPEFKEPIAYDTESFMVKSKESLIIDTRDITAFATSHIPNSLSIWAEGVSRYAGWFIPYDISLFLVGFSHTIINTVHSLYRLGYRVEGYLSEDFIEWHKKGLPTNSVSTLMIQSFNEVIKSDTKPWILDVRSYEESGTTEFVSGSHHIPLTQLPEKSDTIPIDKPVYIFCGSGLRSMTAASILIQLGPYKPVVILGGISSIYKTST